MAASTRVLAFAVPFALPLAGLVACGGSSSPAPSSSAGGDGPPPPPEPPETLVVEHPFPNKRARFGETVRAADLDLDGDLDLVISAKGEGVIYLAYREGPDEDPSYVVERALGPEGPLSLPVPGLVAGAFGFSLEVGQLDDDPQPEILVGAWQREQGEGEAYLFGLNGDLDAAPVLLSAPRGGNFGGGLAIGDWNGDGVGDLAVSAPNADVEGASAGSVWLYEGPLSSDPAPTLELPNPEPVDGGTFGLHLASSQAAHESSPSLYVSAPGNSSSLGFDLAGQVIRFTGPLQPDVFEVAEDPVGHPFDLPRFGMHIASRAGFLSVGAPRKDVESVLDAGAGFAFDPGLAASTFHREQAPGVKDLLGFRVGLGDVVGDEALDFLFVALRPRKVYVWDGADRLRDPTFVLPLADVGDHYGMGFEVASLYGLEKDEVLLGDPTWDRPGEPFNDDVGRVVIHRVP